MNSQGLTQTTRRRPARAERWRLRLTVLWAAMKESVKNGESENDVESAI